MVEWQRGGDKECEGDGVQGGRLYQYMIAVSDVWRWRMAEKKNVCLDSRP